MDITTLLRAKRSMSWTPISRNASIASRTRPSSLLVRTSPRIRRQLKAWLKAGVVDNGELFPTPVGTIQGGNVSPLLINIALHGLETLIGTRFRRNGCTGFNPPRVIRYADDIVILHRDEQIVRQCQELVRTLAE